MKTTLDLPNELVREIKLRAVSEGRKLKDTMADLLRKGLSAKAHRPAAGMHRVKLPLIQCRHAADLPPEQVSDILLKQETDWHNEAS